MVRWGVGWLSKCCATMEVFYGGGVSEVVHGLMYQDLDGLKLDVCLMFFPWKRYGKLCGVLQRALVLAWGWEPLG